MLNYRLAGPHSPVTSLAIHIGSTSEYDAMEMKRKGRAKVVPKDDRQRHVSILLKGKDHLYAALKDVRCEKRVDREGLSRAERIDMICERYRFMVEEEMPTLTVSEWLGIMDACNPRMDFARVSRLPDGVVDMMRKAHEGGVAVLHGYDPHEMLSKIMNRSINIIPIAEIADRFWSSDFEDGRSHEDRLIAAGARIDDTSGSKAGGTTASGSKD